MGNCCSGTPNEGEVSLMQGHRGGSYNMPTKSINDLFDDRIVAGLRGTDKLKIIIRIQSLFRGWLTRRAVKSRFGFEARSMTSHNQAYAYYQNGETNY